MIIPNIPPKRDPGAQRLAVIQGAPSQRDEAAGSLCAGSAGQILEGLLGKHGISRDTIFLGSLSGTYPKSNEFGNLPWDGEVVQGGIVRLQEDLAAFKPTMILCLGAEPLHLFKVGNVAPLTRKGERGPKYVWPCGLDDWRGSLFIGHESMVKGCKCIATHSPQEILMQPDLQPYAKCDVRRCVEELRKGPALDLPQRIVNMHTTYMEALAVLKHARTIHDPVSIDTEGWCSGITVLGWSFHPGVAHVIPLVDPHGESVFSIDEEVELMNLFGVWMEDLSCPKVLQNYLSDAFILAWTYGIVLQGLEHDTMLLAWEQDCELDKGLAVLASLHTREPFWKSRENYRDRLAWVCGMDCAVTLEAAQVLLARWPQRTESAMPYVDGDFSWLRAPEDHYRFNMAGLPIMLYESLRGLLFDKAMAEQLKAEMQEEIYGIQHRINQAALDAGVKAPACDRAHDGQPDALQPTVRGAAAAPGGDELASGHDTQYLAVAVRAFARKAPKEKAEVVVTYYQPMRFNGKRWVKMGKRLAALPAPSYIEQPADAPDALWHKIVTKTVMVSIPVTIDTWDKLEKHCRPSALEDVRRARALVQQLSKL